MRTPTALALGLAVALATPFTVTAEEKKPAAAEQRASIEKMRQDTLAELYKAKPELKGKIAKAPGYAVFSTYGITVFFVGGAGGKGVAVNHKTGKHTYMNMGQASAGLGLGGKELRTVFVFHDAKAFQHFVDSGWEFGGQGTLAATAEGKGGAIAEASSYQQSTEVYQLGKTGLIAEATVAGTKYWKDGDLN